MSRHIVKFWLGTRQQYNDLVINGSIEKYKRYTVKEDSGAIIEYLGLKPLKTQTGELQPVLSIVDVLPTSLNVGDRYLVGTDATFDVDGNKITDASYRIVEIAADNSEIVIDNFEGYSVRVVDRGNMTYQIVDGKLVTFDNSIDCGTF